MNKAQSNLNYLKGYGENFANLRKKDHNGEKDFTVRELAEKLAISPSTISQIEKEKRLPTVEQVNIYKDFFGVSLDYLVGETKVIKPSLKEICEFTGLSEQAVLDLHEVSASENFKHYTTLISKIIESQFSNDFMYSIDEYMKAKKEIENADLKFNHVVCRLIRNKTEYEEEFSCTTKLGRFNITTKSKMPKLVDDIITTEELISLKENSIKRTIMKIIEEIYADQTDKPTTDRKDGDKNGVHSTPKE